MLYNLLMNDLTKRTWVNINLNNIKHNFTQIKNYIGKDTKFLGVVKANAYGHGAIEVAKVLQEQKADYLAVACLDEAIELRNNDITLPILILGHTPAIYTKDLIDYNITQCVANLNKAKEYSLEATKLSQTLKIHIKVDTGMSRLGFLVEGNYFDKGIANIIEACYLPNLQPEGIFTHFSVSDEYDNCSKEYTLKQFELFEKVINELNKNNINFDIKHCCNTGATLTYKNMHLDMVRPGLLLYGYGDENKILNLKPCMSLMSRINTIKYFDEGIDISYGRHYKTSKRTRVATIGIGYADGLLRSLSNSCSFYCKGHKLPQIGNICMDMCMLNVTDFDDVDIEDEVQIFGENNSLIELSNIANSIPYEFMCSISNRVKRIYIND